MSTRLYVGNLSYNTTEESLNAAFSLDGRKVAAVQLMMDRETGRSRGFAFVDMASADDARKAIEAMNGYDLDGRSLRVNEAEERRPRPGGGAGGGGGGFSGGGGGGGGRRGGFGGGGGGGGGRRGGGDRGDRGDRGGGRDW